THNRVDGLSYLRNELSGQGINFTFPNKPLRFLIATAGIRGVYEAAFVFHELKQIRLCTGKLFPEIRRRNTHNLCGDGRTNIKDTSQNKDNSLLAIQTEKCARHAKVSNRPNLCTPRRLFLW